MLSLEDVVLYNICPFLLNFKNYFLREVKKEDFKNIFGERNVILYNKYLNLKGFADILDRVNKRIYIIVWEDNPIFEEFSKMRLVGLYFISNKVYTPYLILGNEIRNFQVKEEEKFELLSWISNYLYNKEEKEPKINPLCRFCPFISKCPLFND